MNDFNEIIKEICEEENIELINYQGSWLKELRKDNKVRFIVGYKFSLNNQSVGLVVDIKVYSMILYVRKYLLSFIMLFLIIMMRTKY